MKKQSLYMLLIILAGISSITAVSAYSGSISAAQGNFNNVLVTGTCTGCGGGEGSFTNWTPILNETVAGTSGKNGETMFVNNDGTIFVDGSNAENAIVFVNGTVASVWSGANFADVSNEQIIGQSSNGVYKIGTIFSPYDVDMYKNNVFLKHLGIKRTNFSSNSFASVTIGISPSGKYIALYGIDNAGGINRLVILQGS